MSNFPPARIVAHPLAYPAEFADSVNAIAYFPPTSGKLSRSEAEALIAHGTKQLQEIAALEDEFAEEPESNGAVVVFRINPRHSDGYMFAALKVGGLWYLTGTTARPAMTWTELLRWLKAVRASDFDILSENAFNFEIVKD